MVSSTLVNSGESGSRIVSSSLSSSLSSLVLPSSFVASSFFPIAEKSNSTSSLLWWWCTAEDDDEEEDKEDKDVAAELVAAAASSPSPLLSFPWPLFSPTARTTRGLFEPVITSRPRRSAARAVFRFVSRFDVVVVARKFLNPPRVDDTDIIIIIVVVVVCAIVLNNSQQKQKKSFSRKKEILRAFVRSVIPLLSSTLVVSLSLSLCFARFGTLNTTTACDLFGKIDVL